MIETPRQPRRPGRGRICHPLLLAACATLLFAATLEAGSVREATAVGRNPAVDAADFFLFRSYEPGRDGYVVLIATYNPLQDPDFGGPNHFPLDPDAIYEIHVANNGDAEEDITFRFDYDQRFRGLELLVGFPGAEESVPISQVNIDEVRRNDESALNVLRSYTVKVFRHGVGGPQGEFLTRAATGAHRLRMPFDNIGERSMPSYESYASSFIHEVNIPGCDGTGRVFVGQREDPFRGNLGEFYDLINVDMVGSVRDRPSDTAGHNVTALALEVPIACLTDGDNPVIGAWTTASERRVRLLNDSPDFDDVADYAGDYVQVSRLGAPLVNHFIIGLPDKDRWNNSHPRDDEQFFRYVRFPTLPEIIEARTGFRAPDFFPRADLEQIFRFGIPDLTTGGSQNEMIRLNTAIPPTPAADQSSLGLFGGDLAGFFNGRRPGDDAFDTLIRGMMGIGLQPPDVPPEVAPDGLLPYNDGIDNSAAFFQEEFPFLNPPLSGSPK